MSEAHDRLMKHIEKLMSEFEHKYSHISNGDLKQLDIMLTNQIVTIRQCKFSPEITELLLVGSLKTILSLNISPEDLPVTRVTIQRIIDEQ